MGKEEPFVVVGRLEPSSDDVWWNVVFLESGRHDSLLEQFTRSWEARSGFMRRVS